MKEGLNRSGLKTQPREDGRRKSKKPNDLIYDNTRKVQMTFPDQGSTRET